MADDFVRTMYEDSEHNMWIGTRGSGLIRFRTTTLKPYGMSEQLDGNCASTAIGDGEGGVWLGTWRSGLFHWTKGRMERRQLPRNRLDILITALAIDSARNLWIGSFSNFWVLRHGHQHAEIIPGRNGNISLRQIFFARDKSLWIISSLGDLSVYQSGDPATSESRSVLAGENVRYISQDRVGVIWLGTTNGLWQLRDIHSAPVPVAQSTSPVLSIFEDRQSRLWTTYEDGNMNVRTAAGTVSFPTSGFPNKKIYKVMEDLDGNFWFSSGLGPVWISGADVDGAIKTPGSNIKVMKMGIADGARTIECRCADNPQSWMSSEGRMWIPTAKGFVEANPGRIGKSAGPNTYIKSIQWDGRGPTADRRVKLPAGSHNLEIHFSAIRPGAADGVSFRYRLEGTDDKWIEAGKDRTARYTQVAPGNHRFLVAARDAMGEWGASSEADVEQQPHLYESLWFECGMIALLLVLMMTIYILRLRGIHKRYDAVLCERSRIAREWHDTLLVGLSAVAWQLDAAIHICTHSPSLISLANARNMLRYCSDEARLAVEELRIESILRPNIEETLRVALQQLTLGTSMTFELDVNVTSPLSGQISRDLLRICQEATANAIQHGKPSKISVSLHSVESRIILSIHDDGVGMDPSLIQMPPPGHFGLMGMRERVQRIGGRLEISSFPGQGTTVKAEVPLTL